MLCPVSGLTAKLALDEICIGGIVGKPGEGSFERKETSKIVHAVHTGPKVGAARGVVQCSKPCADFKPGNVLSGGIQAYKQAGNNCNGG